MNDSQIDLAHAVALGSIGDEDRRAVCELLGSGDEILRVDFEREVQSTRETLVAVAAAAAVQPPESLRERLLAEVAAPDPHHCPGGR